MPAMQKGKKIMFKNNIMNAFEGAHGEINISTGTEGDDQICTNSIQTNNPITRREEIEEKIPIESSQTKHIIDRRI